MKHDNPCWDCPETGCGRHATCESYLAYYNRNRERYEQNRDRARIDDYTVKAIAKQKAGTHSTASRYRPKGRW